MYIGIVYISVPLMNKSTHILSLSTSSFPWNLLESPTRRAHISTVVLLDDEFALTHLQVGQLYSLRFTWGYPPQKYPKYCKCLVFFSAVKCCIVLSDLFMTWWQTRRISLLAQEECTPFIIQNGFTWQQLGTWGHGQINDTMKLQYPLLDVSSNGQICSRKHQTSWSFSSVQSNIRSNDRSDQSQNWPYQPWIHKPLACFIEGASI